MSNMRSIIQKELYRVFGDKKLVFSLFILPAVLMIGIYSLMGTAMTKMMNDIQDHVPTVYVQNSPEGFKSIVETTQTRANMVYFTGDTCQVNEDGSLVTKTMEEIKSGILEGNVDLLLSFDADFLNEIHSYQEGDKNPEIKTYYNPSEDYSAQARSMFLENVIARYKDSLLADRIGDLNRLTVFDVDVDPSTSIIQNEEKANGKMLAMLFPYLIVMLLFTGPMSLGVDAVTGEKERGTMASLLITPIKRSELVMGKLISLSILSCLSAIVYAAAMVIAIPSLYGSGEGLGGAVSFSALQIIELFVIMISLVLLYVAVVMLISVFAKTMKEASTYISPAYFIIIIAGVMTMFAGNNETPLVMFGIPVYGGAVAIQKIMTNELGLAQFGINVGATLLVAILLVGLLTKAFNSEKVMFNA